MEINELLSIRNKIWKEYMKHFDAKKNEHTIPYPYEMNELEDKVYELLKDKDDEYINELMKEHHWIKKKLIKK